MPCICSPSRRSVPLALTDAVGDRVYVRSHHVQFVGSKLLAQPGPEGVRGAAIEFEDHLFYAVWIQPTLRHVQGTALPAALRLLHDLYAPFLDTHTITVALRVVLVHHQDRTAGVAHDAARDAALYDFLQPV